MWVVSLAVESFIARSVPKRRSKDYLEAYAWFNLAADTEELAAKNRDDLAKILTSPQIAVGQRRSQELRAQIDAKLKSGDKLVAPAR